MFLNVAKKRIIQFTISTPAYREVQVILSSMLIQLYLSFLQKNKLLQLQQALPPLIQTPAFYVSPTAMSNDPIPTRDVPKIVLLYASKKNPAEPITAPVILIESPVK